MNILKIYWEFFNTIPPDEVYTQPDNIPYRLTEVFNYINENKYNDKIFQSYVNTKRFTETKSLEKFSKFIQAWFECLINEYSITYNKGMDMNITTCNPKYLIITNEEIKKSLRIKKLKKIN